MSLRHHARQHLTNRRDIEATSIASNRHFPRHAHGGYGIGLMDRGAHRTWTPVGRVESAAGDVITVNPEEMHDGAPIANGIRYWRMIYFDNSLIAGFANEGSSRQLEIARPVLRDADLRRKLDQTFALLTSANSEALAVDEAVACVLALICHRYSAFIAHQPASIPGIARARQRLDDDPGASITLADLAALAGVSRFQLIRGFSRDVGVTPHAYLMQRRVRVARQFISNGRTLAEAAASAGFADQSHMTRAFVRQSGVTPAGYRDALGFGPRNKPQ